MFKTIIKKERQVYYELDGSIKYGEWKEIERKEELFKQIKKNYKLLTKIINYKLIYFDKK